MLELPNIGSSYGISPNANNGSIAWQADSSGSVVCGYGSNVYNSYGKKLSIPYFRYT